MKNLFFTSVLILLAQQIFSQSPGFKLQFGEPAKLSSLLNPPEAVDANSSTFMAQSIYITDFTFQKYNLKTMREPETWKFNYKYNDGKLLYAQGFALRDKFCFLSAVVDKKANTCAYIVHQANDKGISNVQKIATVQIEKGNRYHMFPYWSGLAEVFVSPGNNVFVVKAKEHYDSEKYVLSVRGEDMKEIYQAKTDLEDSKMKSLAINDSGEVYMVYTDSKSNDYLRVITPDGEKNTPLTFKSTVADVEFFFGPNGIPVIAGFYIDGNKEQTDWFFATFDKDGNSKVTSGELEKDFVEEERLRRGSKNKNDYGDGRYTYVNKGIFVKENGEFCMLLEKHYLYTYTASTGGFQDSRDVTVEASYDDDVLVLNFGNQGNLLWEKMVEKRSFSSGHPDFSPSIPFVHGNDIYLFYNKLEWEDGYLARTRDCSAANYTVIDEKGNVSTDQLYDVKKDGARAIVTAKPVYADENTLLMITNASMSSNTQILAKISFGQE